MDASFDQNETQKSRFMYTQKSSTLRCREVDLVGYLKGISKIASFKMDLSVHVFLKNHPKIYDLPQVDPKILELTQILNQKSRSCPN